MKSPTPNMLGLVSTSSVAVPVDILRAAVPVGIGLASAAYLTMKMVSQTVDKSIPTVALRSGDSTHDAEYNDDPDLFLSRCEEEYGPVFNLYILNQNLTVISGPMVREVFMNEDFSFGDAIDDVTGLRSFTTSIIKSNKHPDSPVPHEIIRDTISPNLPLFTPRIVDQLVSFIDNNLGHCDHKLVENPLLVFQDMIAGAMATVFMGSEVAKNRKVIDTFIQCTYDFGKVLGKDSRKSFWHSFQNRAMYGNGIMNPLHKHVQVLVDAATPVILERRKQEAEAVEKGIEYERPLDILQKLLDNFDKYNFVDLEDVCGHLLILVLASVHTTSDTTTNILYYLAAFPEHMDTLLQEQQRVLDEIAKEREEQRQSRLKSGEVHSRLDFEGTDLDPKNDRDLSAAAVKRMTYVDSFVREIFRYRSERMQLPHLARKNVVLSNGMTIHKGRTAIINLRSVHYNNDMQGDDPAEFRPWRFVGKAKSATKVSADFLAFGMGRHACPGRFLAIQELKTVSILMVSKYSKLEIQDPSQTKKALLSRIGDPVPTGIIFTSRQQ
ncbi:hypothetical protein KVV02_008778 [Mortierella alpina]|uniref:Cytochrome P450 n=1 Tax=Mortierella alpina TaxID=64518 RepID=A0A9P8A3R6_MORAP|nr:hypothetical protein KVV02_008778 [Mortierella alpina]